MDPTVRAVLIGTGLIVASIGIAFMATHRKLDDHHGHTDRKLDTVRQDVGDVGEKIGVVIGMVDGMRVKLEDHAQAQEFANEKDATALRRLRNVVMRSIEQGLEYLHSLGSRGPPPP